MFIAEPVRPVPSRGRKRAGWLVMARGRLSGSVVVAWFPSYRAAVQFGGSVDGIPETEIARVREMAAREGGEMIWEAPGWFLVGRRAVDEAWW